VKIHLLKGNFTNDAVCGAFTGMAFNSTHDIGRVTCKSCLRTRAAQGLIKFWRAKGVKL
jgi:hypothetical protein